MADTPSDAIDTTSTQIAPSNSAGQTSTPELITQIRYATALGWAMTELLGRCVVLKSILEKTPPLNPLFSQHTIILSPIRDPRERAYAVMGRILFLAKQLDVADDKISDRDGFDPEFSKRCIGELHSKDSYAKALNTKVRALCVGVHDNTKDETYEQICIAINFLLFYWNENIQIKLQEQPPAVYNGYTVGRGFSTIRWYIGIGEIGTASSQHGNEGDKRTKNFVSEVLTTLLARLRALFQDDEEKEAFKNTLISEASLDKLIDHLRSMSSYLPPLVPQALEFSLYKWGTAILKYPEGLTQGVSIKKRQHMKRALIKQAIIWHDLLTGERDPTTYVRPFSITLRYVWRITAFSVPFIVLGLVLAYVIAFAIIHIQGSLSLSAPTQGVSAQTQSITDTITYSIISLITAATTIPAVRTLWIWGSKTGSDFIAKNQDTINTTIHTTGKNTLDLFWQQSQHAAINKATFVSPGSRPPDVDDGD